MESTSALGFARRGGRRKSNMKWAIIVLYPKGNGEYHGIGLLNVCANVIVREWLHQTLGEKAARDGIGDRVAEILVVFYVNDGLIASRDPVWL